MAKKKSRWRLEWFPLIPITLFILFDIFINIKQLSKFSFGEFINPILFWGVLIYLLFWLIKNKTIRIILIILEILFFIGFWLINELRCVWSPC